MEFQNQNPTIYDDASDIENLNAMFDRLGEKKFESPQVAVACFRKALELFGIILPILEIEEAHLVSPQLGPKIQKNIATSNEVEIAIEQEGSKYLPFEVTYKITDSDNDGSENDWDDNLYLYIIIEKDENHSKLVEAWAQVVDKDELADLKDEAEDEFEDTEEDDNRLISGESEFRKRVRHYEDTD